MRTVRRKEASNMCWFYIDWSCTLEAKWARADVDLLGKESVEGLISWRMFLALLTCRRRAEAVFVTGSQFQCLFPHLLDSTSSSVCTRARFINCLGFSYARVACTSWKNSRTWSQRSFHASSTACVFLTSMKKGVCVRVKIATLLSDLSVTKMKVNRVESYFKRDR